MTAPAADSTKDSAGENPSWIPIVLFWIGIGLYHSGIDDWFRDRYVVQPALTAAFDMKARGGDEIALAMMLEQLPKNPKNPKLLWALGNIHTKMDRPVLAAFYFKALERTGKSSTLDPQWLSFTSEWQNYENPARTKVREDEERLESELQQFERDYHVGAIEHPEAINPVLRLPAANAGAIAGYIPPEYPVRCGPDRPRCGNALHVETGNFWNAVETQSIRINDPKGGPDCCSLSLDDPDLRSLDVVEAEFSMNPEMMDGRLSTATQEGRRVRLAFSSRVLLKQRLVLNFVERADTSPPPDPGWTVWSWAKLIGWLIAVFFLTTFIEDWLERLRLHRSTAKTASISSVNASPTSWQRRIGFVLLAFVFALFAATNFANASRVVTEANTIVASLGNLSTHLYSKQWPGNSISLAAGLTLSLLVLLALNRGWRASRTSSGPLDRALGWMSGTNGRAARLLAVVSMLVTFIWLANMAFRHTTFHFDATQAAHTFKQDVSGLSIRINDRYVYGLTFDESMMHIAAFGPSMVRAFEREEISYGYLKPKFEFPIPGFMPLLCLALLCVLEARRRTAYRTVIPVSGVFLAAGLLQTYVLFWLASSQKGNFVLGDGTLDPWWLQAAVPLVFAQLALLASIHRKLRDNALPSSQLAGWVSGYFVTAITILALAYRVSGAPLLAPAMLWLGFYVALLTLLWWLLLPRSVADVA